MSCLKIENIQAYLDNELEGEDLNNVEQHIHNCAHCYYMLQERKNMLKNLSGLFKYASDSANELTIPLYKPKTNTKKRVLPYLIYAAAASIVFLIVFVTRTGTSAPQAMLPDESQAMIEDYFNHTDMNRLWHQNTQEIVLEDENGNIVYLHSNF